MGACKYDLTEKERTYSVKYALNDAAGVKLLLRDRQRISERRFRGDYAACDFLIDLNSAIESAVLTDRQVEAVGYIYGKWQLTQAEAAQIMKIAQPSINQLLDTACSRIADVFKRWDYGEVTVELTTDNEGAVDNDGN